MLCWLADNRNPQLEEIVSKFEIMNNKFSALLDQCSSQTSPNFLTLLEPPGFSNFRKKKIAVFGCLTNALAPPPIALESCSAAKTDQPV